MTEDTMSIAIDEQKKLAALAAVELVRELPSGSVIGVGTGSTANYFIDALAELDMHLSGAVASSEASAARLQKIGIEVLDLNMTGDLPLYVDGADEANASLELIKGGGGALTREKIVAAASKTFVCIVDEGKCVEKLGAFPLPIEVLPMARSFVARQTVVIGGDPELRESFMTDNGNYILDIHNMDITNPKALESELSQIPGVVTVGLFANRAANHLIIGKSDGSVTHSES